jgi:hypothetical protein
MSDADDSAAIRAFWDWFVRNEARMRWIESGHDPRFDELLAKLREYCPRLCIEVGGAPEGPVELIIGTEGRSEFFPYVRRLVAAAPPIGGWRVIAFKQKQGFDFVTTYEGLRIDPKECWFLPLESKRDPDWLALRIACPGFDPARNITFVSALLVILDTALGELEHAEAIAAVEAAPLPADPAHDGWIELDELQEYLDWRRRKRSGGSA